MYLYLVLLWLLVAYSDAGHSAEIHKWVDKDGNVHYSDSPPSDVITEKIQPPPAPSKDDIRRAQAAANVLIEQQRASADQRAQGREEKRLQKADSQVTAAIEERVCLDARMQLEVLKAPQTPVYRDDQGKWRASWRHDTYKGERTYLDDADRPTALTRARKNVEAHCVVDPQAQDFARTRWILSERCAAAKADLEFLERPDARNWNQKTAFEKQRRLVQTYCED